MKRIQEDMRALRIEKGMSDSFGAMKEGEIAHIYANRTDAMDEIASSLNKSDVSQIRIIGISLNDLFHHNQPINKAWSVIEEYIRGADRPSQEKLDIKVMAIDPYCLGAQLRQLGERCQPSATVSCLEQDVRQTTEHMLDLQQQCRQTNITFEFRLYRLPPIFALWHTDHTSYVQQYYFWKERYADIPIPVIKYQVADTSRKSARKHSFHNAMEDHFDLIWKNATVTATEFLDEHSVGLDEALNQHHVVNVFKGPGEARARILWLIENARSRLYIQGISLDSYFSREYGQERNKLFEAIQKLAERGDIDVRILLLDPNCEDAEIRSFREYLLDHHEKPEMTFEEYRQAGARRHVNSELYRNTKTTIKHIDEGIKSGDKFQVKLYTAAPTCFLLIADDNALVEQYHFGYSSGRGGHPSDGETTTQLLGKQMPIVEFTAPTAPTAPTPDRFFMRPQVPTFELLVDHFKFVFEKCAATEEKAKDRQLAISP